MFNVFPQGTGAAVSRAISPAVQGITNAFTNFTSGPLIRTGGPQPAERPTPTAPTLPSGTPIGGFDVYPTRPQMPPSAPTPLPYGSAPSIYTQTPTQTNLRTGMGGGIPAFPSDFSNINPQATAPLIPFRGGGTAEMSVGGAQVNYPSRLGLMGGRLPSGQVGPLPLEQITPMVAGQRPIIESGPVRMGIAATRTPEQQGKQAVQTPYGTIYATAEQAANMQTPRTMAQSSSRTPEQQQALLAQMREAGAGIKQRIGQDQQKFDQESIQRGYAFRQGLAESAAQRALTPAFGNAVDRMAGAQAMVEAERWKQAQTGRNPMSREPLVFGGRENQKTSSSSIERKYEPTSLRSNFLNPAESFTGSIASNYAPPTLSGFGNRTRISGGNETASSMAKGFMPAFDFGVSVVPSFAPNTMPPFGAIASGFNPSPFNV
jgi:hypothetical protein